VEPRDANDTVAIGASRIAAEGEGEQLEHLFLTGKVETFDAPEHLTLSRRSGKNCRWRGDFIASPQGGDSRVSIHVDIYI
jgi:hypothetical protein